MNNRSSYVKKSDWKFRKNTFRNGYFIGILQGKSFENSQRSIFQVINFRENVQNSEKSRKFLPTKVSALKVNCFLESFI